MSFLPAVERAPPPATLAAMAAPSLPQMGPLSHWQLFVHHLPLDWDDERCQHLLACCGPALRFQRASGFALPNQIGKVQPDGRQRRPFGFVEYADAASMARAVRLLADGHLIVKTVDQNQLVSWRLTVRPDERVQSYVAYYANDTSQDVRAMQDMQTLIRLWSEEIESFYQNRNENENENNTPQCVPFQNIDQEQLLADWQKDEELKRNQMEQDFQQREKRFEQQEQQFQRHLSKTLQLEAEQQARREKKAAIQQRLYAALARGESIDGDDYDTDRVRWRQRRHFIREIEEREDATAREASLERKRVLPVEKETLHHETLRFQMETTKQQQSNISQANISNSQQQQHQFNQQKEDDVNPVANAIPNRRLTLMSYTRDELLRAGYTLAQADAKIKEMALERARFIAASIPVEASQLFAFPVAWDALTPRLMQDKILPWLQKKVAQILGFEEPSLVDFIMKCLERRLSAPEMIKELQVALDKEAESFVIRLWRFVIFETEYVLSESK